MYCIEYKELSNTYNVLKSSYDTLWYKLCTYRNLVEQVHIIVDVRALDLEQSNLFDLKKTSCDQSKSMWDYSITLFRRCSLCWKWQRNSIPKSLNHFQKPLNFFFHVPTVVSLMHHMWHQHTFSLCLLHLLQCFYRKPGWTDMKCMLCLPLSLSVFNPASAAGCW